MPGVTSALQMTEANPTQNETWIREVWQQNLEEEFVYIRKMVNTYRYVAIDTEFPGVVAKPLGKFYSAESYQYQKLILNVNILKVIQIGITFFDENGNLPPGCSTWQFNFRFQITEDIYAQKSIDLLADSGIQFNRHQVEGIEPNDFAELLISSGLVLMDNICWIGFHSGYDFGYLLKILSGDNILDNEKEFFELLRIYFPVIYDVRYLMESCKNLRGGLQEVAEQLNLKRIGIAHQAGSDSLLTGTLFFKIVNLYFDGNINKEKYSGHVFGLPSHQAVIPAFAMNQAERALPYKY